MASFLTHASRPDHLAGASREAADLAACRDLLRRGSKTFFAASLLLPRWMRERATAVYAFCRVGDDAVDEPGGSLASLARLERRLAAIYAGRPEADPVDRALTRVVERCDVPRDLFEALLEGFRWDLHGRRYDTLPQLEAYAARVAASVGVIMAVLMGRRDPASLARAADLGVAMQLTNVARDVGEDARRGRIYLPRSWLDEARVDLRTLGVEPRFTPALGAVVARLLGVAEALYHSAEQGIPALPRDTRVAITAARHIYADIGRLSARRGFDGVTTRVSTTGARKLWLLLRSLPAALRSGPAPDAPPLAETRFLVECAAARPAGRVLA